MMRHKLAKILYIMIAAVLMCGVAMGEMNVLAAERGRQTAITHEGVANFRKGTSVIRIQGNEGQTLIGKEFRVYQLFTAENSVGGESINYRFSPEYQEALKTVVGKKIGKPAGEVTEYAVIDYIQTLHNHQVEGSQTVQTPESSYSRFRYFVEELRNEMRKQNLQGDVVRVTSVKGGNIVEITGLTYGYYIVDEVTQVEGTDSAASLCMVNTTNPSADIRTKSDFPTVVKKIQEDDGREKIGNDGWNDIADFEIGQTVPYRFTSRIPNMNGYDTYYFAWHDKMDPALTFHPKTVKITLRDPKMAKTYTLKNTEFQIVTEANEDVTFRVEISNLKAIVDREFDRIDTAGENTYGQEIVLRYDAVLNETAVQDIGRPGFENDVKLEFSNNPDSDGRGSTGETPWDTVVCFTYKLNGLKTNHYDRPLQGAKFRLYADEACEEEVYVRKKEKEYYVMNRDSMGGTDHTGGTIPPDASEIVSDEKGIFTIWGLDGGNYWIKETEAPAGYRPILDPVKVEVKPTYTEQRNGYVKGQGATNEVLLKLEYHAKMKQFLAGNLQEDKFALETDAEEGAGNLTIINRVGVKLPATGSYAMPLLMLGGIGCMVFAFRKYRKHEE